MAGKLKKGAKRRNTPYSKFKAYMQENNIRQADLARLLGKTITTVNQNLNGTGGDFSMDDVRTICCHYKVSCDALFINKNVS